MMDTVQETARLSQGDRPLRILIAEDDRINQKVMRMILEQVGYQADVVENGKQAVEAVSRNRYDVILMDIQMPEMDGIEATQCIRAMENGGGNVLIIAVTANALYAHSVDCRDAGLDDYVPKPVRVEDLCEAMARHIPLGSDSN